MAAYNRSENKRRVGADTTGLVAVAVPGAGTFDVDAGGNVHVGTFATSDDARDFAARASIAVDAIRQLDQDRVASEATAVRGGLRSADADVGAAARAEKAAAYALHRRAQLDVHLARESVGSARRGRIAARHHGRKAQADAQQRVDAAEARLMDLEVQVAVLDTAHDAAVDALARATEARASTAASVDARLAAVLAREGGSRRMIASLKDAIRFARKLGKRPPAGGYRKRQPKTVDATGATDALSFNPFAGLSL